MCVQAKQEVHLIVQTDSECETTDSYDDLTDGYDEEDLHFSGLASKNDGWESDSTIPGDDQQFFETAENRGSGSPCRKFSKSISMKGVKFISHNSKGKIQNDFRMKTFQSQMDKRRTIRKGSFCRKKSSE